MSEQYARGNKTQRRFWVLEFAVLLYGNKQLCPQRCQFVVLVVAGALSGAPGSSIYTRLARMWGL